MAKKRIQSTRYRNWSAIVYNDSAPPNWQDKLALALIPAFISPIHDSDLDPEGQLKKAHWHVILMFSTVKSKSQVDCVLSEINAVLSEPVFDICAASRYLCHLNQHDKVLYSTKDVLSLNGADYLGVISLVSDKMKSFREILDYIQANNITSFVLFCDYCAKNEAEWFRLISEKPYFVKELIKSQWLLLHTD